ncbi:MAG: phosphoribosylglycinamide formyltransferase [Candidatus Melainabacteria bacterium]|nr:phosphoribosylglycinamide formyltransferase [Candidatus Melainabacteria bacterium]
MADKKKKLAVLVSGSGTNLQAIINAVKSGELEDTKISIVISNKQDAYALKRAENENIENIFLNPKDFKTNIAFDKKLVEIISSYEIDLIVLAGYTKILTEVFVNAFPKKIINIHPALLPDFGGKGMYGKYVHEAVLKSRVKQSGCTVHFVTSDVDAGPIILQKKVPVLDSDTAETLSHRILEEEHKLLVEAIRKILFECRDAVNRVSTI